MSKFRNVLEQSLATSITPEMQTERRNNILELPSRTKRVGALAIHEFATRFPSTAAKILGFQGVDFVGAGADSTVFRQGDQVVKVHRRSVEMGEPSRQILAAEMDRAYKVMASHLPDFILAQTIDVAAHPIRTEQRAVQIHQRYYDWYGIGTFLPNEGSIDLSGLAEVCRTVPGIDDALRDFVHGSRHMHAETGFLPDTTGINNLVLTRTDTPELVLIDGQPIGTEHAEVQDKILSQLDQTERALASI